MFSSLVIALGVFINVPLLTSFSALAQSQKAQEFCSPWLNSPYPD